MSRIVTDVFTSSTALDNASERGHINGATYILVRVLPDGTTHGGIRFGDGILYKLNVTSHEWREVTVTP